MPSAPGLGITIAEPIVRARHQDWDLPDANWRHPDGRIAEW